MEVFYTKDHEWASVDGNIVTVGISGYAADLLGDITYVELPLPGKLVRQGDVLCEIESVKSASEVYSPVTGKILESNPVLESNPEIINSSAQEAGWIVRIEAEENPGSAGLMSGDEYKEYLAEIE